MGLTSLPHSWELCHCVYFLSPIGIVSGDPLTSPNQLLLQDYQLLTIDLEVQDNQICLSGENQQHPRGTNSTMTALSKQRLCSLVDWLEGECRVMLG